MGWLALTAAEDSDNCDDGCVGGAAQPLQVLPLRVGAKQRLKRGLLSSLSAPRTCSSLPSSAIFKCEGEGEGEGEGAEPTVDTAGIVRLA